MTTSPERALFVYGVIDAGTDVPEGLTGLDESPLHKVVHGDVAAVVGGFTVDRPPSRRRDLVAYNTAVDRVAGAGAVIPVRFGSALPDEQAVAEELLAPAEAHFADLLRELAHRSQYRVQASYLQEVVLAEVVAADPEIAELHRHTRGLPEEAAYGQRVRLGELVARAMEARQHHDADQLLAAVLTHAVAHVVIPSSPLDRLLDVAVLVDDDAREPFEEGLEELAEQVHERIQVRLLGPTAPYDFVGEA